MRDMIYRAAFQLAGNRGGMVLARFLSWPRTTIFNLRQSIHYLAHPEV